MIPVDKDPERYACKRLKYPRRKENIPTVYIYPKKSGKSTKFYVCRQIPIWEDR